MCRFALYAGPATPLSSTLYDPPRSLEVLAYAPRELLHGHVNVDGTGVAWWPGEGTEPLRYVTPSPPWSDANLPSLARRLTGTMHLAAVRSATPGIPFGPGAVAPFLLDGIAGAHNGWIGGWRDGIGRRLVARLPDDLHARYDTASDSLALFLTAIAALRAAGDGDLAAAARRAIDTVTEVLAEATPDGGSASLNLALADGDAAVVTRTAIAGPSNSLYVRQRPDAVTIASEPLDDEAWEAVPDDHLVLVEGATAKIEPLS